MNLPELQDQVPAFREFNQSKGLAAKTTLNYCKVLRYFCDWLAQEEGDNALVTTRRLRGFLAAKRSEGKQPATLRTYYCSLRAFFSFLVLDAVVTEADDPMKGVKVPRASPPDIEPLTEQQVIALLESFDKDDLTDFRNFTMVALMLDTGLRRLETTTLRLPQINLSESSITVKGKGGRTRVVYMGEQMRHLMRHYLQNVRPWFANGRKGLFPPIRSERECIDPNYISTVMRKKMDEVGIARANSSCHRLRRTFASAAARNGMNVFALQQLLGHSSLEMTRRYVRLTQADLALEHAKASPFDALEL